MGVVSSLREQAARVFALIDDERHLAAHELLVKVQERLSRSMEKKSKTTFRRTMTTTTRRKERREIEEVKELLAQKASTIATLQVSCLLL